MMDPNERLDVTLLTRSNCSLCEQARVLLDRVAADYPLAITTIDVDQPEGAALAVRTGVIFTPGIVIGAEAVASGRISERRLREGIERRLPDRAGNPTTCPRWSQRGRSVFGWLARSW